MTKVLKISEINQGSIEQKRKIEIKSYLNSDKEFSSSKT